MANTPMSSVRTLADGSFAVTHVAPGLYYVYAAAPGYIDPLGMLGLSREELLKPDKTAKEQIRAAVPRVMVQAKSAAAIDVTLERGAAVSGTVLYDDGSPAAGLQVRLLKRAGDKGTKWIAPESEPVHLRPPVMTDDRGSYRISGLPAKTYLLEVDLHLERVAIEVNSNGTSSNSDGGISVPVYSGNCLRDREATPFQLKQGEERPGEDIEVPLGKLHGVTGMITAALDGHVVNGGQIELLYADDKSQALHAWLAKDDAGFSLSFVPEGDYVLRVTSASDVEYDEVANAPGSVPATHTEPRTLHRYGPTDQPLHVGGEVSGLVVSVPALGSKRSSASPLGTQ